MRCMTAAQIKRSRHSRIALQSAPREGSKIRKVYDLFQSNKGLPVEFRRDINGIAQIDQLQNFYGLDIRSVQRGYEKDGYCKNRPPLSVLAGEWFGRVYVDYIAERIGSAQ